ncbi:hypothetical protein RF11_15718 [Thelohanellus kitauei]|uniref:WSC domain-containing protein n=1 Tax=Thelohanellus kitauei TaxID=669202 RepID=A0A0C2N0P3_THEKT|nr:hypothetical protein RF11_15718 [Thelohanellus kitauei]
MLSVIISIVDLPAISITILLIVMNLVSNTAFYFFLTLFYCLGTREEPSKRSSKTEEDLSDIPDIEIDDTLANDPSEIEYTKKEPAGLMYDASDFNDDSSDVVTGEKVLKPLPSEIEKKNEICYPADTFNMCACRRACFPTSPYSLDPCNCNGETVANTLDSPPLLASQPSIPSFSSSLTPANDITNCLIGASNPYCACLKACVPGVPVSYEPCACVAFDPTPQPTISNFGVSMFPQTLSYANPMQSALNFQAGPALQPVPVLQPAPAIESAPVLQPATHRSENSCARACLPYAVQQSTPCTCNFDSMDGRSRSQFYSPMFPTVYNSNNQNMVMGQNRQNEAYGYQSKQYTPSTKSPSSDKFVNSHIKKVPRPENYSCVNKCREKKKRFAAVQNGYLCFCGSRFGRYNKTKDEKCGTPCTGDPKKYCGGHWLNAVYSTDGQLYSPKQFSFKTKDPKDELEYDKKHKKQKSKHSKKKTQNIHSEKDGVEEGLEVKKDETTSKKAHLDIKPEFAHKSKPGKTNHAIPGKKSRKTILETAVSASDMAHMLALGKKNLSLSAKKSHTKTLPSKKGAIESGKKTIKPSNSKVILHGHE